MFQEIQSSAAAVRRLLLHADLEHLIPILSGDDEVPCVLVKSDTVRNMISPVLALVDSAEALKVENARASHGGGVQHEDDTRPVQVPKQRWTAAEEVVHHLELIDLSDIPTKARSRLDIGQLKAARRSQLELHDMRRAVCRHEGCALNIARETPTCEREIMLANLRELVVVLNHDAIREGAGKPVRLQTDLQLRDALDEAAAPCGMAIQAACCPELDLASLGVQRAQERRRARRVAPAGLDQKLPAR